MGEITKIKVNGDLESSYKIFSKNREFEKRAECHPDWNQNDSTKPDYVKNRPFYMHEMETFFVEESTITFANKNGIYQAVVPSTFKATGGETYKVSWDGTVYECTCAIDNGLPAFGNISIMGPGSDTGEPFYMGVENGAKIHIFTADTSASHTISISGLVQEVVKIDENYLPDVRSDWNVNDETSLSYVKNRPFYTTLAGIELVNGTFRFIYNSAIGFYANSSSITIEFTEGKTYKVTLDGVEYETVCKVTQDGMLYIGAPEFISGGTPPSDMPFVCTYNTGNGKVVFATITGDFHSIIIKEVFTQIVKIPEQYIPEMRSVTLLSSTPDSTKRFKITVDDNGTITATEIVNL